MKKQDTTNRIQTLIDDKTLLDLNRLIMIEALENGTSIQSKSEWVRNLILDTLNFELNRRKIDNFNPTIIKQIKNK